MTISSTDDPRAGPFNGNGSQTAFPFEFKAFSEEDLLVVRTDADGIEYTLVLDSDYSVSLNADQDADPGGTVTYPISGDELPTGETLTIASNLEFTQTTDITNGSGFYPRVIENALDRLVMLVKQVNSKVSRSLQLAVSTPAGVDVTLPVPVANNFIGWDDSATGLRNVDPSTAATIVAFAAWQSQTFDGDGSTTQFVLSSDPGNINNLDIAISGVTQTPGIDFTLSGTTLTFTEAPPAGTDNVFARWGEALPQGTSDASQVTFTQDAVGAVERSAEEKLRERVSFFDFMTLVQIADVQAYTELLDVSAAVQAAIDHGASLPQGCCIEMPLGGYRLDNQIVLKPGVSIKSLQKGSWSSNSPGAYFANYYGAGDLFYSPATQTLEGCEFEGFWIKGRKDQSGYTGGGIRVLYAVDCIFRRVWVHEAPGHGFQVGNINGQAGGSGQSYHNYFYNCYASFNGGDGYYNCSDWTRLVDCWADGNLSGFNNAGGSHAFLDRPHFEEFETAAVNLTGTNGFLNANITVRDATVFSRPYLTAHEASGIKSAGGQAGYGVTLQNCRFAFQTNHAVLGTQVAFNLATNCSDWRIENCVVAGYSAVMNHGTLARLDLVANDFDDPITITSGCAVLVVERNVFRQTTALSAASISGVDNTGWGNHHAFTATPSFAGNSVGMTGTFSGWWTARGRSRRVNYLLTFTNTGSSVGTLRIPLPTPVSADSTDTGQVHIINADASVTSKVHGLINAANGYIELYQGLVTTALQNTHMANTTQIYLTIDYDAP